MISIWSFGDCSPDCLWRTDVVVSSPWWKPATVEEVWPCPYVAWRLLLQRQNNWWARALFRPCWQHNIILLQGFVISSISKADVSLTFLQINIIYVDANVCVLTSASVVRDMRWGLAGTPWGGGGCPAVVKSLQSLLEAGCIQLWLWPRVLTLSRQAEEKYIS